MSAYLAVRLVHVLVAVLGTGLITASPIVARKSRAAPSGPLPLTVWSSASPAALFLTGAGLDLVAEGEFHKETTMRPVTIDLQAHPNLQFRIDAFSVPAASRPDFEAAMRRNLAFIETLPGFLGHVVFEKTTGPSTFDIVTIAIWESPEAVAGAGEKVRAHYQSIGFDMSAMLKQWGVTAALGNYHAPLALQ